MSIIVVEGVDASGKSTLLENARIQIKNRYFVLLRHSCRPLVPNDVSRFLVMLERSPASLTVVIDRHPLISEPIYGPLLRGSNLIDWLYTPPQITEYLQRSVDRIIYCRPKLETIRKNLGNNAQLGGVEEKLPHLLEAYDKRMSELARAGISVMQYDYKEEKVDLEHMFFGGWA